MKLRTSFFNKTALHKDITRFLPAWLLYLIFGLLSAQTNMPGYDSWGDIGAGAYYLANSIAGCAVANMAYALLTAQLLFGDLFNSKLCNALHALPLRRESWFATHTIAGIGFSVVPNLLIALSMMPYLDDMWYVALIWLLGMTLEYLFFFGLAVFSANCTGSRFGMAAVYAILNFLAVLVSWFASTFYEPLLYGVSLESTLYQYFSPVVGIMNQNIELVKFEEIQLPVDPEYGWQNFEYRFQGMTADWWYPAVLALVGIGLLVAAVLLYRRRKLESAGDFIAFRPIAVGFSVIYTLCIGAGFQLVGGSSYIFLIAGILVGFITGQMLLERTVKVFHKAMFAKLGVFVGVLAASLLVVGMDPMGLVEWTPKAEQVESVSLNEYEDPYGYYYADVPAFTDGEQIDSLIAIHEQLIEEPMNVDSVWDYVTMALTGEIVEVSSIKLTYYMEDGRKITREYYYDTNGEIAQAIKGYLSAPEYVMGYDDWNTFLSQVTEVYVDGYEVEAAQQRELLEAIKADCEAGTMAQDYSLHPDQGDYYSYYYVQIDLNGNGYNGEYIYLEIFSDAENTMKWIEENVDSYEDVAEDIYIYS